MTDCGDCGAKEGELHKLGCDMERCPFCEGQLIICPCRYLKLGFDYNWNMEYSGLPKEIYEKGLPVELEQKWEKILEAKGRMPYIDLPNYCRRCLAKYPCMFTVEDKEWNKLPKNLRNEILCRPCYDLIKKWMEKE